jgi:hypothetical protein
VAAVEIIDPATGAIELRRGPCVARAHHTATLLPSGRMLVAGGSSDTAAAHADAELWDPATDDVVGVVPMRRGYRQHATVLLGDGSVLIAGEAHRRRSAF